MAELTIREAADALGVSVDTIRRRVRRGELAARRDARGWILVDMADALGSASPMQPPADLGSVPYADGSTPLPEVVQRLEEENRWLRGQLDEAARERAELRQLLAGALRALRQPAEDGAKPSPQSEQPPEPPTAPRRRSWRPSWLWLWRWPSKAPSG